MAPLVLTRSRSWITFYCGFENLGSAPEKGAEAYTSTIVLLGCQGDLGRTETTDRGTKKSKGITTLRHSKVKEERSKTCTGVVASIGPSEYPRSHCDNCATLYPVGNTVSVGCDCDKLHTGQPAIPINRIEYLVNTPDGCTITFSSVEFRRQRLQSKKLTGNVCM